jgi:hypothetical protein
MGDTEETVAHQAVEVNENEVVNVENDQQDQQQQSKDGEEVGDEEGKKRKPMTPRSDVWEHFSKIKLDNGEERAKCKYCGKQLRCDTKLNGTSSMKAHLKIYKKNPHKPTVDNQGTLQLVLVPYLLGNLILRS